MASTLAWCTGPARSASNWPRWRGDVSRSAGPDLLLDTTLRGALPIPVLHLAPPAGGTYRFGRREYVARPRTAMFVARGWEFTRLSKPGAMLALALDEDALLQGA